MHFYIIIMRSLWSWSYGSWIYNYLCNQCLSPLTLWVRIALVWGVFNTTICDNVCQWLVAGQWFSLGTPVPSTNKSACHNITEILLKVALNIKTPNPARAETILPFISETIPLYNVMYGSRTKAPPF